MLYSSCRQLEAFLVPHMFDCVDSSHKNEEGTNSDKSFLNQLRLIIRAQSSLSGFTTISRAKTCKSFRWNALFHGYIIIFADCQNLFACGKITLTSHRLRLCSRILLDICACAEYNCEEIFFIALPLLQLTEHQCRCQHKRNLINGEVTHLPRVLLTSDIRVLLCRPIL
jgi:hypothetical protein